jgi:cold shock CspA family protein
MTSRSRTPPPRRPLSPAHEALSPQRPAQQWVQQHRFRGRITCFYPEKKYGFIRCEAVWRAHQKNVLGLATQIGNIGVGSTVTFTLTGQRGGYRADNIRAEMHTGIPADATFTGVFTAYYVHKGRVCGMRMGSKIPSASHT